MAKKKTTTKTSTRRAKPKARPKVDVESFLLDRGWKKTKDGWRHKNLAYPWPKDLAYLLQIEADDGRQESAHRSLRGED